MENTLTASILLVWAAAAGLGGWFRISGFASRTFLGCITIPVILLFLSGVFGLGLRTAAWTCIGAAVLGAGLFIRREIPAAELQNYLRARWTVALNPVVVIPLMIIALIQARGYAGYVPLNWDEFTSWILWPKEQFLLNALWTSEMTTSHPAYPPGWHLMMAFPQLFAERFEEARLAGVWIVPAAAFLGLLTETALKYAGGRHGPAPAWSRLTSPVLTAFGLAVVLAVCLMPAFDPTVHKVEILFEVMPSRMLIEPPQIVLNTAWLLLIAARAAVRHTDAEAHWLSAAAGLALAAGYLMKSAMVLFVPLAALAVFWIVLREPDSRRSIRSWALTGALMLGPFAVVFLTWQTISGPGGGCLQSPVEFARSMMAGNVSPEVWNNYKGVTMLFLENSITPASAVFLALAVGAAALPGFRIAAAAAWVWAAVYMVVLYLSYEGCFTGYAQQIMVSSSRYQYVAFATLALFGAAAGIALAAAGLDWAEKKLHAHGRLFAAGAAALAGAACVTAAVFHFIDTEKRLQAVNLQVADPASAHRDFAAAILTGPKIREVNAQYFQKKPVVTVIAQKGVGWETAILRYIRIKDTPGGDPYLFEVSHGYRWGLTQDSPFTTVTTADELLNYLESSDIIWPVRLDAFTGGVFNRLTADPQCRAYHQSFLLVKNPDRTDAKNPFICVLNEALALK